MPEAIYSSTFFSLTGFAFWCLATGLGCWWLTLRTLVWVWQRTVVTYDIGKAVMEQLRLSQIRRQIGTVKNAR